MSGVPSVRVRALTDAPRREDGRFVLYWMIGQRRLAWNHALDRAVEVAEALERPVLVLEALGTGYPHASRRLHQFVIDGMVDNLAEADDAGLRYHPYVEPEKHHGRGLVATLVRHACHVVTDEVPFSFLRPLVASAARQVDVSMEAVDSAGLLPMRGTGKVFPTAYAFRRHLQKHLPRHLGDGPRADGLSRAARLGQAVIPRDVLDRWPAAPADLLRGEPSALAQLPVDDGAEPVETRGGPAAGREALDLFVSRRLSRYGEDRNHPDEEVTSGLSPYLHFGHVSPHEVFQHIVDREGWTPERLSAETKGKRAGWWGMSEDAEAFLDQVVTWRELGLNAATEAPDVFDTYEGQPDWARKALALRAADERDPCYELETFERAETYDEIWNAAQRQLVREGTIHNYLRMLWGKKILEWSTSPEEAWRIMVHLNDRYALDGRDPNSYSGIGWVLGRYDRAWGPKRPIFGTIRYMSSDSARRKLHLDGYLGRFR